MRRFRPSILLGLLLLCVAPGCRVLAGAAAIAGEVALDVVLSSDDDDDGGGCESEHRRDRRAPTPNPRRSASRPAADPTR
ncbi:MAG TPA: hypothetical protein VFY93_08575 [Planctomycetota bacterium]|nr:hypothetical protein [Planctomycetota bacterium]